MAKPNIAIMHYSSPPVIGGVEYTIAAHARLLSDNGYPVNIIAGRGEQFDPRVPVRVIPTVDSRDSSVLDVNRGLAGGMVTAEFHSLSASIIHALEDAMADVDICIAHNVLTLHKNLALTAALHDIAVTRRKRLIAWCHDFAWDDPVYAGEMHIGFPWDLLKTRWEGVQYVVVSEARRKELARLLSMPEAEISVVPPGVDALSFMGISEAAARWVHELRLLEAKPLLLLPARVTRRKNIELAIEITAALRGQGQSPKLVVMGPLGPHNPANAAYLDELRALARERAIEDVIIFLSEHGDDSSIRTPRTASAMRMDASEVDDAARRDLYLLADALLFTSEREGFGIPVLEAGLARLPVFCSDIPPFRESAREWAAGYFPLDKAPADIARLIAASLDSDARYQLKHRVLRQYAWPRIFKDDIEPLLTAERPPLHGAHVQEKAV